MLAYTSLALVLYVYVGYPLLLSLLQFFVRRNKILVDPNYRPFITFIISCFNEEKVIEAKLKNTLAIDYPVDRFEIIVVSDASTDRTEEIVRSFSSNGVKLLRQDKRRGKTAGLNLAVSEANGELLVFSDANAMYEPDAVLQMVKYFADPNIGYVVGQARYKDRKVTASGQSEGLYWQYEIALKKMESNLHSVVGGDGAIYTVRRELYEELLDTDINDFVNPLQVVAKGYRGIYEPNAICWEETSGFFDKEFNRKVRIVNRAFNGLLRVKEVLNPFRVGFFALEIISHKLLRWLVPFFLILFLIASIILALNGMEAFQYVCLAALGFAWLSYAGYLFSKSKIVIPIFHYPYYFTIVNIASIIGVLRGLCGKVPATWNPPRLTDKRSNKINYKTIIMHVAVWGSIVATVMKVTEPANEAYWSAKFIWGSSIAILFYIYCGFPLLLMFLAKLIRRPVKHDERYLPDVALLICAYNEEDIIEEKITNCFELDYPSDKIKFIIASDGSKDKTSEIVNRYAGKKGVVFFDYQERRGKIGAILATVPKISADVILFSDANTMAAPDSVRKLVRNLSDPTVGGVSADVILVNDQTKFAESESLYYRYERWIQEKETQVGSMIGADGGLYAIRRELFVAPSPNIILDDFVISMNVVLQGFRLVFESEAKGYEKNVNSCFVEFQKKSRVVAGAVQAIKQGEGVPDPSHGLTFLCYFSHKLLRWHVPIFLIVIFGLTMYLYLNTVGYFMAACLYTQLLFYSLSLLGGLVPRSFQFSILRVPFYFCLINSAALYGLYKGWFNKQPTKWRVFSRQPH